MATVNRDIITKLGGITVNLGDLQAADLQDAFDKAKKEYEDLDYAAEGKMRTYDRKLTAKSNYEAKVLSEQGNVDAYTQVVGTLPDGDLKDEMNTRLKDAEYRLRKAQESLLKNGVIPLRLAEIELVGIKEQLVVLADQTDAIDALINP